MESHGIFGKSRPYNNRGRGQGRRVNCKYVILWIKLLGKFMYFKTNTTIGIIAEAVEAGVEDMTDLRETVVVREMGRVEDPDQDCKKILDTWFASYQGLHNTHSMVAATVHMVVTT